MEEAGGDGRGAGSVGLKTIDSECHGFRFSRSKMSRLVLHDGKHWVAACYRMRALLARLHGNHDGTEAGTPATPLSSGGGGEGTVGPPIMLTLLWRLLDDSDNIENVNTETKSVEEGLASFLSLRR